MTRPGSAANAWTGPWPCRAWPRWARWTAAASIASSRVVPPVIAIAYVLGAQSAPRAMLEALVALGLLPAIAAWLLERAFAARATSDGTTLWIERRDARVEVPLESIADTEPWRVPLPGAGAALRLRSGARLAFDLEPAPPIRDAVAADPAWIYAAARRAAPLAALRHPLVRFGAFGLIPTGVLFRAHQIIAFGGFFGQQRMEGAAAWTATLVEFWVSTLLGLALYAATFRLGGELLAWTTTWLAPARARVIRSVVEWGVAIAYYAGVPALLAIRFLA